MGKVIPGPQLNEGTVAKIQNINFIEIYDCFIDFKENYDHYTNIVTPESVRKSNRELIGIKYA